jgi:hypothetical protein
MKNYRIALISACYLLSGLLFAQDQPKTVTFRCVAGPASRVIPMLGKAIGIPMSAVGPIASTVLMIQVKDAPLNDVLARVAKVTSGGWQKMAGGYSLVLSDDQARDDKKAERDVLAAAIKAALARMADSSSSATTGSSTETASQPPRPRGMGVSIARGPTAATIVKLLSLIGPSQLADLRLDTRTVYALPATRSQIPLPNGSTTILSKLMNDLADTGAIGQVMPPGGFSRRGSQPVMRSASKAQLIITRTYLSTGITVELRIGDVNGQTITQGSLIIQPVFPESASSIQPKTPNKVIELSEEGKFFAQNLRAADVRTTGEGFRGMAIYGGSSLIAPSTIDANKSALLTPALKDIVTAPDKRDPLEFVVGESLGKLADLEEANIVACIPDSSLVPAARSITGGKISVGLCLKAMTSTWDLSVDYKDGVLMVSPARPSSARTARMNRTSLAKTMLLLSTQGYATLDQKAAYVRQQPMVGPEENFELAYLKLIHPGFANSMQTALLNDERKMLRIYADFTPGQRRVLSSGQSLSLNNLSAQQKTMVYEMTFGPSTTLTTGPGGGRQLMMMSDMTREVTEVLPVGVPSSGYVLLRSNVTDAVYGIGQNGERTNTMWASFGPMMMRGGPNPSMTMTDANLFDKFQLGKSTMLTFMFALSPNASFMKTLLDDQVDTKAKVLTKDELPDWYQRRAEMQQQMMQRMTEQFQQMQQQSPPRP